MEVFSSPCCLNLVASSVEPGAILTVVSSIKIITKTLGKIWLGYKVKRINYEGVRQGVRQTCQRKDAQCRICGLEIVLENLYHLAQSSNNLYFVDRQEINPVKEFALVSVLRLANCQVQVPPSPNFPNSLVVQQSKRPSN